jgi:hypothetical protein
MVKPIDTASFVCHHKDHVKRMYVLPQRQNEQQKDNVYPFLKQLEDFSGGESSPPPSPITQG